LAETGQEWMYKAAVMDIIKGRMGMTSGCYRTHFAAMVDELYVVNRWR
jgi:hypothetical protein